MKTRLFFSLLCAGLLSVFFSCSSDDGPAVPTERPEPTMNASDSLALTDIYKAADGDNWGVTWDLTDWYTWGGVTAAYDSVNNEYRVIGLVINQDARREAQGYISPRVGDLPYLMLISAAGDGLRCELSEKMFRLPYLQDVTLVLNINSELPGFVFQAPSLEYLYLFNSGIYGELPEEIAEWDNPNGYCFLTRNHLTGKVPSGIQIGAIWLDENEYTSYPYEYCFADLPQISMRNNPIYDTIPDEVLNDLEALRRLWSRCKGDFTNEPDWWHGYIWPFDDEEEETSFAATTRMMSAPLKTRIEILDDVKLPGR